MVDLPGYGASAAVAASTNAAAKQQKLPTRSEEYYVDNGAADVVWAAAAAACAAVRQRTKASNQESSHSCPVILCGASMGGGHVLSAAVKHGCGVGAPLRNPIVNPKLCGLILWYPSFKEQEKFELVKLKKILAGIVPAAASSPEAKKVPSKTTDSQDSRTADGKTQGTSKASTGSSGQLLPVLQCWASDDQMHPPGKTITTLKWGSGAKSLEQGLSAETHVFKKRNKAFRSGIESEAVVATAVFVRKWFSPEACVLTKNSPSLQAATEKPRVSSPKAPISLERQRSLAESLLKRQEVGEAGARAEKVASIFRLMDENGDGTITRDELTKVLQEISPLKWIDERIIQLLSIVDKNGDGVIQYEEFVDWIFDVCGDKG
eukprot:gnl/TRDRNA2_/TRDRNA2_86749_c1_seq1.p1 gnl/TRDRNA2_/TRDRNA2_86749_c1~~gnl/TRDRNA2_/TRDRNA2_86749_c1_seq1.p1  ORF type:complete len:393 (-),score=77.81 gnl/TRDRNA2_/TRDRNA2_86749_c1_seq1:224-1354(-)